MKQILQSDELKLILKTNRQYIILPIVLVALHEIAFLIKVKLVVSLQTDMFIEIIDTTYTYRALRQVSLRGETIFRPDLIATHLRIRIVNVIFQYSGERRGTYVLYQIEKVTKERTLKQGVLR